ncbi:MAG: hypothetical protein N2745_09345 [Syntrophorhabdaceae bacterium]|nr:hypothetical protein [Syntrophorhabdaceae bacterium]
MKKYSFYRVILFFVLLLLVIITDGRADNILNLRTLPNTTYYGYYVGAIGGNIDGGYAMKFYCNDFSTTTYIPSSFAVAISTLSDLSQTKFGGSPDALLKYQQAGWLISQMESNPSQVGPIQFAIWNLFSNDVPTVPGAQDWLASARSINTSSFNFSEIRVYTPTNTRNQEFIGGTVHSLDEPSVLILIIAGLLGTTLFIKVRCKKA